MQEKSPGSNKSNQNPKFSCRGCKKKVLEATNQVKKSNPVAEDEESKSDQSQNLNIANTLNKLKIPYKYECPLEVRKGLCFYPDFTVLNVRKRKVYYWEHRGMMDDREYAKHAVSRIKEYESNGIIIGKNLIISEETSSTPLGSNDIIRLIDAYLLS